MQLERITIRWDVIAGLAMVALAAVFLITGLQMNFGTLRQMGPGFLPVCVSVILGGLGLLIAMEGLLGKATVPDLPRLRPFAVVVACPLVFGAMIEWAGMVPTVVTVALVARLAEPLKWGWDLILVPLSLCVLAVVVFIEFIGVAIPIFSF